MQESLLPQVGVSWVALSFGPVPALILMVLLDSGLVHLAEAMRKFRR